jgi:DNA repair exonuclease SbcCD nuclease subunit
VLQIGDIHFGVNNSNKQVFESQMEFFEVQVFPFILANKITDVMSLGDVFHDRNKVDGYIMQELKSRFFGWFERNKVNFHVIVGNHDCYYKNTLSHHMFKENFNEFKYCTYYDEITKLELGPYRFAMVPWVVDHTTLQIPTDVDIVIGHFEIVSFPMMRGVDSIKGLEINTFSQFQLVESGHFHIQSTKGNISYLGSTQQLDWGDFNEPKGFWLLKDNFQLEFIENTVNPKFVKVIYDESEEKVKLTVYGLYDVDTQISPKECVEIARNHYVKLITNVVKSQSKLDKLHMAMVAESKNNAKIELIAGHEVLDDLDFAKLEENIKENASVNDTIKNFVIEMPPVDDIDQEMLAQVFDELYRETKLAMMENE